MVRFVLDAGVATELWYARRMVAKSGRTQRQYGRISHRAESPSSSTAQISSIMGKDRTTAMRMDDDVSD
jgi:hypothetical protein